MYEGKKRRYGGTARTDPRGCRLMNLHNGEKEWPIMFERACDIHNSPQSFFQRGDVACMCVGNLVGPLGKPLSSPLRGAELVAAVDELETDP